MIYGPASPLGGLSPGTDDIPGRDDVDLPQVRRNRAGVAAYFASGDLTADLAALLRRWTGRRRPAVLVVLDWDIPFAEVYPEDELLREFPDAPRIDVGPIDEDGPGRLLIFVIDEEGEMAYAIADPRAAHGSTGMPLPLGA
jgi:hypothetical protein